MVVRGLEKKKRLCCTGKKTPEALYQIWSVLADVLMTLGSKILARRVLCEVRRLRIANLGCGVHEQRRTLEGDSLKADGYYDLGLDQPFDLGIGLHDCEGG